MVVHHPGSLHERVQDRAAAEFEPAGNHILAHGIGNWTGGWNFRKGPPAIVDSYSTGESPQVCIQSTKIVLDFEDTVGIVYDGVDFGFIADDPRVSEQFLNFCIVVVGNQLDIKIIKRLAEILSFV